MSERDDSHDLEDHDWVRRVLAETGSRPEPTPDWVGRRVEETLASLREERQQHAWYTESASAMLLLMPPELSRVISQNSSLYHPICTSVYAKASTPTFFTVQFHHLELYKPGRYGELSRHLRGTNDVL